MSDALKAFESGQLRISTPCTLLLDYDGTLVPLAATPDLALPDPGLLDLLERTSRAPAISLHLVTGRSIDVTRRWFGRLPIDLWAEHGALHRAASTGAAWESTVVANIDWMPRASDVLESARARTPGALVERKTTSLVWHYRLVEPQLAAPALSRLRHDLRAALGEDAFSLMDGKMMLELRPHGVSKALAVQWVMAHRPSLPIVAIGDDRTDEEMFAALPESGTAIYVGDDPTRAPYRLADTASARLFVSALAGLDA